MKAGNNSVFARFEVKTPILYLLVFRTNPLAIRKNGILKLFKTMLMSLETGCVRKFRKCPNITSVKHSPLAVSSHKSRLFDWLFTFVTVVCVCGGG